MRGSLLRRKRSKAAHCPAPPEGAVVADNLVTMVSLSSSDFVIWRSRRWCRGIHTGVYVTGRAPQLGGAESVEG
eukprot:8672273-Pyramimonas_sp.AAC.1